MYRDFIENLEFDIYRKNEVGQEVSFYKLSTNNLFIDDDIYLYSKAQTSGRDLRLCNEGSIDGYYTCDKIQHIDEKIKIKFDLSIDEINSIIVTKKWSIPYYYSEFENWESKEINLKFLYDLLSFKNLI